MNYNEILEKQLCLDFNTNIYDLRSAKNLFTLNKRLAGRRLYEWDDCILKIGAVNNKFIMTSDNQSLLNTLKEEFKDANAGFIGRFDNLSKINKILAPFGHEKPMLL